MLSGIIVRCGHCAHTARLEAHSLTEKLGQALSISVLPELFASLRCTRCAQRKIRIYDEKGQVLLDYAQITPCRRCGLPIPIPRLAVLPGCRLCLGCAMEESRPVPMPPHPRVPLSLRTCPRCGHASVVRENHKERVFFVGCSAYPGCRWTTLFV